MKVPSFVKKATRPEVIQPFVKMLVASVVGFVAQKVTENKWDKFMAERNASKEVKS